MLLLCTAASRSNQSDIQQQQQTQGQHSMSLSVGAACAPTMALSQSGEQAGLRWLACRAGSNPCVSTFASSAAAPRGGGGKMSM
jgi:hypothetical protein